MDIPLFPRNILYQIPVKGKSRKHRFTALKRQREIVAVIKIHKYMVDDGAHSGLFHDSERGNLPETRNIRVKTVFTA